MAAVLSESVLDQDGPKLVQTAILVKMTNFGRLFADFSRVSLIKTREIFDKKNPDLLFLAFLEKARRNIKKQGFLILAEP